MLTDSRDTILLASRASDLSQAINVATPTANLCAHRNFPIYPQGGRGAVEPPVPLALFDDYLRPPRASFDDRRRRLCVTTTPSLRDFGVVSCVFVMSRAARPYCWPAETPIESDIFASRPPRSNFVHLGFLADLLSKRSSCSSSPSSWIARGDACNAGLLRAPRGLRLGVRHPHRRVDTLAAASARPSIRSTGRRRSSRRRAAATANVTRRAEAAAAAAKPHAAARRTRQAGHAVRPDVALPRAQRRAQRHVHPQRAAEAAAHAAEARGRRRAVGGARGGAAAACRSARLRGSAASARRRARGGEGGGAARAQSAAARGGARRAAPRARLAEPAETERRRQHLLDAKARAREFAKANYIQSMLRGKEGRRMAAAARLRVYQTLAEAAAVAIQHRFRSHLRAAAARWAALRATWLARTKCTSRRCAGASRMRRRRTLQRAWKSLLSRRAQESFSARVAAAKEEAARKLQGRYRRHRSGKDVRSRGAPRPSIRPADHARIQRRQNVPKKRVGGGFGDGSPKGSPAKVHSVFVVPALPLA